MIDSSESSQSSRASASVGRLSSYFTKFRFERTGEDFFILQLVKIHLSFLFPLCQIIFCDAPPLVLPPGCRPPTELSCDPRQLSPEEDHDLSHDAAEEGDLS